jgi:hypothetical protein
LTLSGTLPEQQKHFEICKSSQKRQEEQGEVHAARIFDFIMEGYFSPIQVAFRLGQENIQRSYLENLGAG